MLKTLNDKLRNMRETRIKCEELAMTMSFLEGGEIKTLKSYLRKYNDDNDNDQLRENVDTEVNSLINIADLKRKQEDLLGVIGGDKEYEEKKAKHDAEMSDSKFGHLSWLNKLIDLNSELNSDVCLDQKITNLS